MRWLDSLFDKYYRWQTSRKWRNLVCPHGILYTSPYGCGRCPYPMYGYGRKMRARGN